MKALYTVVVTLYLLTSKHFNKMMQADFIVTHGGEVSVSRAVRRVAPDELFSVLEAEQGIVFDVIDF